MYSLEFLKTQTITELKIILNEINTVLPKTEKVKKISSFRKTDINRVIDIIVDKQELLAQHNDNEPVIIPIELSLEQTLLDTIQSSNITLPVSFLETLLSYHSTNDINVLIQYHLVELLKVLQGVSREDQVKYVQPIIEEYASPVEIDGGCFRSTTSPISFEDIPSQVQDVNDILERQVGYIQATVKEAVEIANSSKDKLDREKELIVQRAEKNIKKCLGLN